ncbi:MAG: HAMP domain-containing sensor histidine kinase, partial [Elusimicrobiota bacterium]
DLRNPMTSIRGFLKFLIDGTAGPINEQQKKMISTMDVASMRLLSMINDILDLAKLETGRMDLQLADVNLMQVVQRVIQIMEPQIAKKSILVNVRFDGQNQNATLKADTRLIERVINNLLGNAVKFVTEKGLIDIMVKELENGFELTVSDNGDGIPHEYLDKIFDKFQQVAGQRKGGTGLGLTICKYIVESHRGKIWVNSKVHEGSTFGFYIPRGLTSSSNGEIRYATSL